MDDTKSISYERLMEITNLVIVGLLLRDVDQGMEYLQNVVELTPEESSKLIGTSIS